MIRSPLDSSALTPDFTIALGDPEKYNIWQQLSDDLQHSYVSAEGLYSPISMLAIDAGFATLEVYAWVREQSLNQVMAINGTDKSLVPLGTPSKVGVTSRGKKLRRGVRL